MNILWLRPDKPADVSVGRHRITKELEDRDHDVKIRNASFESLCTVLSESPDVIVGTTKMGAFVGAWKKLVSGTPLVVDHIDPIEQLHRSHNRFIVGAVDNLERFTFRFADHVMVVYEEELERVERHASAFTKTVLGVDYQLFSDPPSDVIRTGATHIGQHVPEAANVLIYIGGLEPPYKVPTVVESLDHLDGWHLVVLGDGSQREWLESEDAARDDVHYLGTVPYEEVPGYLHAADVGISLLDDPNTLKVLEYGSAGLPVVHAEGSAEETFGELMEYCSLDPHDVAVAVQRAEQAATDEDLRALAAEHDWERVADTYEAVLQDVTDA